MTFITHLVQGTPCQNSLRFSAPRRCMRRSSAEVVDVWSVKDFFERKPFGVIHGNMNLITPGRQPRSFDIRVFMRKAYPKRPTSAPYKRNVSFLIDMDPNLETIDHAGMDRTMLNSYRIHETDF